MSSLSIYIDSWCPLCLRFGSLLKKLDVFGNIQQKDIRTYDGTLISKEKGLQQLTSLSPQSTVIDG